MLPERVLDNSRGIRTNTKLKEDNPATRVCLNEILIPTGSLMPSRILNESRISAQIHAHRLATPRAVGDKLAGDSHVMLLLNHARHGLEIVIGRVMTRNAALPQAVVALGVEQSLFRESCELEAVVNIRCEDEEILACEQLKELVVGVFWSLNVAVVPDVATPIRPLFFQGFEWIKAGRVHIGKPVGLNEIREVCLEAFATVGETCGC